MEKFKTVKGNALPLNRADVDTDQIIPAQYLKRIERTGFGQFAWWIVRRWPRATLHAVDIKPDYLDRAKAFLSQEDRRWTTQAPDMAYAAPIDLFKGGADVGSNFLSHR